MLIVAASPASLRRALDTLLIFSIELFTPLGLVTDWNPGKTEVMFRFRSSGSMAEYEQLRSGHWFGVPIQCTDLRVNVVHSYKHLGGVLQSNLSNMMFVDARVVCDDNFCPACRLCLQLPFHRRHVQASICMSLHRVLSVAPGARQMPATRCTCVCTAASLTAHDITTLPILIWTSEFDITLRAWMAPSPDGALTALRDLPEAHVVKCSLVFSRCGLRNSPSCAIQVVSLVAL